MTDSNDYYNKLIWKPSDEFAEESNLQDFIYWLENEYSYSFENYDDLFDWSISASDEFWESILEYYRVLYDGEYESVRSKDKMPYTKWFEGIKLSYAEHIFRKYTDSRPAIVYKDELGNKLEVSWQQLVQDVASFRKFLIENNVVKGDRVAAFINNSPQAITAFLACNSIGAVWSSASPDFGISSVVERFGQIEPKVLIGVENYSYNGKDFEKTQDLLSIAKAIPSVENIVIVGSKKFEQKNIHRWKDIMKIEAEELSFERVDFSHPIWILYSSGTTGAPKAIAHSVGGILLEHYKILGLHNNVKEGERFFWFTTTGWMMWNYLTSSLLHGATVVLYDGSPSYPNGDSLWSLIDEFKINHFGLGASFVVNSMKKGYSPKSKYDMSSLISIGSTGSPLVADAFDWLQENIKENVWISSISGGTDVCSAFVAGNPFRELYSGEIQCIALGCDLKVYNEEGESVFNEIGEMIIEKPMPSMPIFFWGDDDFKKYKSSYFEYFQGVWRHGDWIKITSTDSIIIYGRSDATLNRAGVRIGSSEIYRAVDKFDKVEDSLVISTSSDKMIIFLKLKDGFKIDEDLISDLKRSIKVECSPRHIPDLFYQVMDIPYTISGKKMETPIKKIFDGQRAEDVLKVGSMRNPESLNDFVNISRLVD